MINEALLKHQMGELDEAEIIYLKILDINPVDPDALHLLGVIYYQRKKYLDAIKQISKAIDIASNIAIYYCNRGNALKQINDLNGAKSDYEIAIALKSDYVEAHVNLGTVFQIRKQFESAMDCYDKAIGLNANLSEVYMNRGILYQETQKYCEAIIEFSKAIAINPDAPFLIGMRENAKMFICDWEDFENRLIKCISNINHGKPSITPLTALILFDDPELHYKCTEIYSKNLSVHLPKKGKVKLSDGNKNDKIKIGYFSADFRNHPVSIMLAEQIEGHSRDKFELHAFSLNSRVKDSMHERFKNAFDYFHEVDQISDSDIANLARSLGIHIAIDLGGYSNGGRPLIFSHRAAPIQVSYMGFPGTMCLEFIDYFFSDKYSVTSSSEKYFSEKIIYLNSTLTYDSHRKPSNDKLSREKYNLPQDAFIFTCQNGSHKISPDVFNSWMNILHHVPNSVLWLLETNSFAKNNLISNAKKLGISENRLIFSPRGDDPAVPESVRIGRYLASYRLADLFLDTWPYNAGTTAVDALRSGLPVLTKAGRSLTSRMAGAALHHFDWSEMIATDVDDYERMAVSLALDTKKLLGIKQKIALKNDSLSSLDIRQGINSLENAYEFLYLNHNSL